MNEKKEEEKHWISILVENILYVQFVECVNEESADAKLRFKDLFEKFLNEKAMKQSTTMEKSEVAEHVISTLKRMYIDNNKKIPKEIDELRVSSISGIEQDER